MQAAVKLVAVHTKIADAEKALLLTGYRSTSFAQPMLGRSLGSLTVVSCGW